MSSDFRYQRNSYYSFNYETKKKTGIILILKYALMISKCPIIDFSNVLRLNKYVGITNCEFPKSPEMHGSQQCLS